MKKCSICKQEKKKKEFWKSTLYKDGLRCSCIECLKKKNKEYLEKNKKKILEYQKKYYNENKEKVLRYHQEYRETNPEKIKISQARTYYTRDENDRIRKKENARRFRKTEKYKIWAEKYKEKVKEKNKCRWTLCNAVRDGKIIRPNICDICKKEKKVDAHHDDYSKPLEVKWVCRKCHHQIHINQRGKT